MESYKQYLINLLYTENINNKIEFLKKYCSENNKNMNYFNNFLNIVLTYNYLNILVEYVVFKKIRENNINITVLTDLKTNKILKIY